MCEKYIFVISLIVVLMVSYKLYGSEQFVFNPRNGMEGPFVNLLGGFGTPIKNFNDVPQLQRLSSAATGGCYTDDMTGNLYLDSAHRVQINNIM